MSETVSLEGTWNLTIKSPAGAQPTTVVLKNENGALAGTATGQGTTTALTEIQVNGNKVSWVNHITKPMKMKVTFTGEVSGNNIEGSCKAGFMGSYKFSGSKQA